MAEINVNLQTLKILYGLKDIDVEYRTSKTGKKYLLIKRQLKGENYKAYSQKTSSPTGHEYLHGFIVWFNNKNCTINSIKCKTFRSNKGFSKKLYQQKVNNYYNNIREEVNHMDYVRATLGEATWLCKFKIEKPDIILRNCKNGKKQFLLKKSYSSKVTENLKGYVTVKKQNYRVYLEYRLKDLLYEVKNCDILIDLLIQDITTHLNKKESKYEPA